MRGVVRISEPSRRRIEMAAFASLPRECCGLLVGYPVISPSVIDGGEQAREIWVVDDIVESANVAPVEQPDRFEIDPALLLRMQRELRPTPMSVIGFYHSHPGGGVEPSSVDRDHAWQDGLIWLIAGCGGIEGGGGSRVCDLAAYLFDGAAGKFESLTLEVTSAAQKS